MSRRDKLRNSIDGAESLREILHYAAILAAGQEQVTERWTGEVEWRLIDSMRTTQLSKAADIHFRLLNKVLPDLRAVELSGPDGAPVELGAPANERMVLATKLLALLRDGTVIEGVAVPELPEPDLVDVEDLL